MKYKSLLLMVFLIPLIVGCAPEEYYFFSDSISANCSCSNITYSKDTLLLNDSFIIIDDDSQNLANFTTGYIDDVVDGGTSYGDYAIQWDISSLNTSWVMLDVQMCFYINADHCDDDTDISRLYGVRNYSWGSAVRNLWSNTTLANASNLSIVNFINVSVPNATGFYCQNITAWIKSELSDGRKNFTINQITNYDADAYDDYFTVRTKDYATVNNRPYLNISYKYIESIET